MPVWEVTEYRADCDECEWSDGGFPTWADANTALEAHLWEDH